MVQSSACRSPCQNPHHGENKLAGGTLNEDSNCCTPAPAATLAPTPAASIVVAPFAASGSADSFVVRYLEDDLQRILRIVLDFRLLTPVSASVVATVLHYESQRERPLKAWFPDIYWGKTHLECYNFFQQCKNHFATANATGPNQDPFATTFLNDTALFQWQ